MKLLRCALAVSVIASAIVIPAHAETTPTVLINDGFDYEEGIGSWSNTGNANAVVETDPTDTNNKAAKLYASSGTVRMQWNFGKEYTDGVFNISYRIQSTRNNEGTNEFVTLFVKDTNNSYEYFLPNFMTAYAKIGDMSNTNPAFVPLKNASNSQDMKLEGGQWFTVNATVDLDNGTATATVTDPSGTAFTATNAYNSGIDSLQFISGWNGPTVYVDDVRVTYTEPAPINFSDNFDSYTDAAGVTADGTLFTTATAGTNSTVLGLEDNGSGKALKITRSNPASASNARLYWNAASTREITTGTVGIEFDIRQDAASRTAVFVKDGTSDQNTTVDFKDNYSFLCTSNDSGYTWTTGTWYHVNQVLDLDNDKLYVKLTDMSGNVLVYNVSEYTKNFTNFQLYNWYNGEEGCTIDNLTVKQGVPVIAAPAAKLETSSEISYDAGDDGKSPASGIKLSVTNNGDADGSYSVLQAAITKGTESVTARHTENITLAKGASVVYAIIFEGVDLTDADVEVTTIE
ncbi:MAG: hypothetical protein ACI4DP_02365 [Candidatus Ornithomonoglobus sp.]